MATGYASRFVDDVGQGPAGSDLTSALGCTVTSVRGVRLGPDESAEVSPEVETLVVPVRGRGRFATDGKRPLRPGTIALSPAGAPTCVEADGRLECVTIGAAEAERGSDLTVIDLDEQTFAPPETSDVPIAWLTGPLGCTGMKVNARRLGTGQRVPYHTEGDQEELFIPVRGPASMVVDDNRFDTPVGTIMRVGPAVPRSAVNPGDDAALWVMIGAPPTGDEQWWDPGATILPWPEEGA